MKMIHKYLTTVTLGAIGVAGAIGFSPLAMVASAQVLVNSPNYSYTQNFNTLSSSGNTNTWTDNTTLTGWYASLSTYRTTNDGTSGALYSFGSTGSSDRALGSSATSGTGNIYYALRLKNTTGQTITNFTVSYTGEQWYRTNTSSDNISLSYQVGAASITSGTWTPGPTSLTFTNPQSGNPATALDGNVAANRSLKTGAVTIAGTSWTNNSDLWIRWQDANQGGADQGLGIDDVTVSVPEPTTILGGMAALGIGGAVQRKWQRARRKVAKAQA